MKNSHHEISASTGTRTVPRPATLYLVAITCLLVLTACSSSPSSTVRKASDVNLSGFSPEYKAAFDAGCERARAGGKVSEAPTFRNAAAQTVQGWLDGFDICRRSK